MRDCCDEIVPRVFMSSALYAVIWERALHLLLSAVGYPLSFKCKPVASPGPTNAPNEDPTRSLSLHSTSGCSGQEIVSKSGHPVFSCASSVCPWTCSGDQEKIILGCATNSRNHPAWFSAAQAQDCLIFIVTRSCRAPSPKFAPPLVVSLILSSKPNQHGGVCPRQLTYSQISVISVISVLTYPCFLL